MIDKKTRELINGVIDDDNMRIYFWKGIFSQWYRSPICDPTHNVQANCAEQLMMAYKAWLFVDTDSAKKILTESSPRIQKQIGREVKNFDQKIWEENRLNIVSHINYLKFSQNQELKNVLIQTKDYELVEASPEDKIWGIGLHETDPRVRDKSQWQGLNLLGQAIMNCRKIILDNE